MSIEVGSKVRAVEDNGYGFRTGMVGEVIKVYPEDHYADGTRLYGVSFAESGEPDPHPSMSRGWAMTDNEIEEV